MDVLSAEALYFITRAIEWCGIIAIVAGIVLATWRYFRRTLRGKAEDHSLRHYRADIGRGILLGLEFLVAADIIATVALEPTLESLAVLAGIIVIRTFLSLSLEVEITGRLPWRQEPEETQDRREAR